jgi:hypothetical protein
MSLLGGAALKGLGDAGSVLARGILDAESERRRAEERRLEREERLAAQRDLMREREELLALRAGGTGGARRSGGVLMDPNAESEYLALATGMNQPELERFREAERTGNYDQYAVKGTVMDDEYGEQTFSAFPPGFEEFKRRKRAELAKAMETVRFTDDIDKIAKGRQTDVETALLGKAAQKDRGAQEALLISKGKDPLETEARAVRQEAAADKDKRTDPNLRRPSGGGGSSRPAQIQEKLTAQLGNLRLLLKHEEEKGFRGNKALIERYQREIADVVDQLRSIRQGTAIPAPSPAGQSRPAPQAGAPAGIDMERAKLIRQRMREGLLTRAEAEKMLKEMGFQ